MNERITEYTPKQYYGKFGNISCPNCKSLQVKEFIRSKGGMRYRVYVCARCKFAVGREIVKC